jgi:hypothetical protein
MALFFIKALNSNLNLQRYEVLYICGNHSSILRWLDRSSRTWRSAGPSQSLSYDHSRRALSLAHLIEHDPLLYEDIFQNESWEQKYSYERRLAAETVLSEVENIC